MPLTPGDVRIFISYAHEAETDSHNLGVQAMAAKLKELGFLVFLDVWQSPPPNNWGRLIKDELARADRVLCVCTPTYAERADGQVPGGVGRGVAYETALASAEAYDQKMQAERFLAVQVDEDAKVSRPKFLGSTETHLFLWHAKRKALVAKLTEPTTRRRILNALRTVFDEDTEALKRWAKPSVELGHDVVLEFDTRALRVVHGLMTHSDATVTRRALEDLIERRANLLGSLQIAAKHLKLGRLRPRSRPQPATPQVEPATHGPLTSREFEEYRQRVAYLEEVELDGFSVRSQIKPGLRQVFVKLRGTDDQLGTHERVVSIEQLDARKERAMRSYEPVPLDSMFERAADSRAVVLLGEPGSGKTTQLKWMHMQLLDGNAEALSLPAGTLPVFLPLRQLRVRESLTDFIQRIVVTESTDLPKDFAARLVRSDNVLFLLDGLDEVADAEDRAEVAKWIDDRRTQGRRGHYFVVTCRHDSYAEDARLGGQFFELHLTPLDDEEVQQLVRRWYEQHCAKHSRPAEDVERWSSKLIGQLESNRSQHVAQIKRNPLLLTAICMVRTKHPEAELPTDGETLFRECTDVLLETWPSRVKGKALKLQAEEARQVLQPTAYRMQEEELDDATEEQVRGAVQNGLERIDRSDLTPLECLESMRDVSGLITGWREGQYRFVHRGFREYLAAKELRRRPDRVEVLAEHFDDTWWREVIPMALAKHDELFEEFMQRMTEGGRGLEAVDSALLDEVLAQYGGPLAQTYAALVRRSRQPKAAAGIREIPKGTSTGTTIESKRGGIELVKIPAGWFLMGSPDDEVGRHDHEGPRHRVDLKAFYLARTPVTNAQYRRFLEDPKQRAKEPEYWGDRRYNRDEQPVVGVSWEEAKAYCKWAGLSLPTEAQWEYACRAGTTTRYYSGDDEADLAKVGWYDGNSQGKLQQVGQLQPNDWGLYDMHGNVYEWCLDALESYSVKPRADDGLRKQPVGDANRVFRGGGFIIDGRSARSAYRYHWPPGFRYYFVGFRPAQGIP